MKIIVPIVTVFDENGKPDVDGNKVVMDYVIESGVDGILVLGSTGEFTQLSLEEKKKYLRSYADCCADRVELYAGTGGINFHETLELSNYVYTLGYKAPLIIGPYYYGMNQEKIYTYYNNLAKQLDGKMYIYNYPDRSGYCVEADTIRRLVDDNPNIVGVKDTVHDPWHTNQICQIMDGTDFEVYSGFDDQFLYNLAAGGMGNIGGLANIVPEIWSDLVKSANSGDYQRSIQIERLLYKLMPVYMKSSSCSLLFKLLLLHRGVNISTKCMIPYDEEASKDFETMQILLDQVLIEYQHMIKSE